MASLNAQYWENRYQEHHTPWDIGYASPPLMHYIDKLVHKNLRILIPGAGHAYEAIKLHQNGFTNVYVCDWAPSAFEILKTKAPDFPTSQLYVQDFFSLDLQVDLILEQTFFCALPPALRPKYVLKTAELLAENGKLAGVLFAFPFENNGPPYGGSKDEYLQLFGTHFDVLQMDIAKDSIKPRAKRELFIELSKKKEA
jgi:SAM-dependent methyltransferase